LVNVACLAYDRAAAEPQVVGGAMVNHCSSLTGYNFLSLSLALGIVKRQSIVARAAFRSDSQAPTSLATITWLPNLRSKHCSVRTDISTSAMFNQLLCSGV
jgi:hypothetical protein